MYVGRYLEYFVLSYYVWTEDVVSAGLPLQKDTCMYYVCTPLLVPYIPKTRGQLKNQK